jgi:hypothetical protein
MKALIKSFEGFLEIDKDSASHNASRTTPHLLSSYITRPSLMNMKVLIESTESTHKHKLAPSKCIENLTGDEHEEIWNRKKNFAGSEEDVGRKKLSRAFRCI